jgi:magnesium transporter
MPVEGAGDLSALERLIRDGSEEDIQRFFLLLRPPELADLLETIREEDRLRVLRLMNAPLAAEVLREVEDSERDEILDDLSAREVAEIVHEAMSDDAADLIQALPKDKAERTLNRLDAEEREEIKELLEYGEETAGGIMQTEVVKVPSNLLVQEAIDAVRDADPEEVGEIHEVFFVDEAGRLVGSLSPADLLQADPNTLVRDVMEPDPVRVPVEMDQEQLAEVARENDLAAIPVVDDGGILVGQVLHDDVADVIEEEATEDIAKLAGTDPDELYHVSVWRAVWSRLAWLIPGFIGGLLVAVLLSGVHEEIKASPLITFYLVVIIGMAGNVGTQNAAVTVRAIALGRVERAWKVVGRHVLIGFILGVAFGALLFAFVMWDDGDFLASLTLAITIATTITVGAILGALVPLVLNRLGADPAISATPFITTANDVAGAGIAIWMGRVLGLL